MGGEQFVGDKKSEVLDNESVVGKTSEEVEIDSAKPEIEQTDSLTYPDQMDQAFCSGILDPYEKVKGEGSWAREESAALQRVRDRISFSDGRLIDAGCGMGRLSLEFAPVFGSVIAVEADEKRIQEAILNAVKSGFENKIEFQNTTIQKMEASGADMVICSHIIQHVPAETILEILQKLNDSLKSNGILALSTNNSGQSIDKHTKLYWDGSKNIEEDISKEEFGILQGNRDGVLPIHWFSRASLKQILQDSGFGVEDVYCYHNLGGNEGEDGRDVQIIARKKSI